MLSALLCHVERKAHGVLDVFWKIRQVRPCAPNPKGRFKSGVGTLHHVMPQQAYEASKYLSRGGSPFYSLLTHITHNGRQTNGLQFTLDNQYQYVIIGWSTGKRTSSVAPQVMRLRRAVPKIPAKSSVLPRLPLNKNHSW